MPSHDCTGKFCRGECVSLGQGRMRLPTAVRLVSRVKGSALRFPVEEPTAHQADGRGQQVDREIARPRTVEHVGEQERTALATQRRAHRPQRLYGIDMVERVQRYHTVERPTLERERRHVADEKFDVRESRRSTPCDADHLGRDVERDHLARNRRQAAAELACTASQLEHRVARLWNVP
jgi:hypothetical protein